MKSKKFVIGSVLAVSAVAAAVAGIGRGSEKAPAATVSAPATATRLATVVEQVFATKVVVDGEVANLYSPEVSAELAGKVVSVHVEPGQRVKKGDLLAVLDAVDAKLLATADQAEVARLKALAVDKQSNHERLSKLVAQDLVSRAEAATAQQEAHAAVESVKASMAKAAVSARTAGKAEVRAPFDGEIASRAVAPGAYLKAGDVIATLIRPEESFLRLTLPEAVASLVTTGMHVGVSIAGAKSFDSTVTSVIAQANRSTRAVTAQVALPSSQTARPGTSARVELTLQSHQGLAVPETAVITEGSNSYVFVAQDGVARRKDVQLGARMAGAAEVKAGIAAGDVVATDAAFVFDGGKLAGVTQ